MAKAPNRADVIRKVQGLMALAERSSEHEAAAAREKVIALRLRHGIGDDEMAAIDGDNPEIMGMRFLFYGQRISPLMDRIRGAVDSAIALIGDEAGDVVDLLEHFRKDLKFQDERVAKARDEVVRKLYWQRRKQLYPNWDDESDGPHAHTMTVSWIKGDLRKDHVERIVGVFEKDLYRKHWAWIEAHEDEDDATDS